MSLTIPRRLGKDAKLFGIPPYQAFFIVTFLFIVGFIFWFKYKPVLIIGVLSTPIIFYFIKLAQRKLPDRYFSDWMRFKFERGVWERQRDRFGQ